MIVLTMDNKLYKLVELLVLFAVSASLAQPASAEAGAQPTPQKVQVTSGDRLVLDCRLQPNLHNSGPQFVFWLRNEVILSTGRNVFAPRSGIFIHGDDELTYNLVLNSVVTDDEGVYQCQVPPDSLRTVQLTVNVRPSLTLFYPAVSQLDIQFGDILQLECRANGKPTPDIHWTKQQHRQQSTTDATVHRDTTMQPLVTPSQLVSMVIVEHVTSRDSGVYLCTADNGVGVVSRQIDINVIYAPKVTIVGQRNNSTTSGLHVGFNDVIELVCVISSNPMSIVTWSHNNTVIDRKQARHNITFRGSEKNAEDDDVSILRVHKVELDDVGVYTCHAVNSLGVASDSILIAGIPDRLLITSDDLGDFSDQYAVQFSVRSLSKLDLVQLRIKSYESVRQHNSSNDYLLQDKLHQSTDVSDIDEYGQRNVKYVINGLQPNTMYSLTLRTSNVFGYSSWTPQFYFETAEEGRLSSSRITTQLSAQQQRTYQQTSDQSTAAVSQLTSVALPVAILVYKMSC